MSRIREILVRVVECKLLGWYFFPTSPIFIIAFVVFLIATFVYPELPPGKAVSNAVGMDPTVRLSGFLVTTLTSAILNGVIYGTIIWLILFLWLLFTYKGD